MAVPPHVVRRRGHGRDSSAHPMLTLRVWHNHRVLPSRCWRGPVALANEAGVAGSSLTLWSNSYRHSQASGTSSSPAVPLPCHSQRSWLVSSGQSRTTPQRARPAPITVSQGDDPARSGFASRGSGRPAGGDPNPNGPRWVRMTPATSGTRRARAVTRGRLNPQVSARSWRWPVQAEESDSGFESHLAAAASAPLLMRLVSSSTSLAIASAVPLTPVLVPLSY